MQALGTTNFPKEVLTFRMRNEGRSRTLSPPGSELNDYNVENYLIQLQNLQGGKGDVQIELYEVVYLQRLKKSIELFFDLKLIAIKKKEEE